MREARDAILMSWPHQKCDKVYLATSKATVFDFVVYRIKKGLSEPHATNPVKAGFFVCKIKKNLDILVER